MKLSDIGWGLALLSGTGTSLAQGEIDSNIESKRICAQPFAGSIVQVSCENIANILKVAKQPIQPTATTKGEYGGLSVIRDADGNTILYIYGIAMKPKKGSL